jgi:hypothetical protein
MKGKLHLRTVNRIHILVRLELANPQLSSLQVAQLAGISGQRYVQLKNTTLYRQIQNQYMTGVVLPSLDEKVRDVLGSASATLKFAVPAAMQELARQALMAKDDRVRNKACNDILDRDGHFAKVTRVGVATEDQGGAGTTKDEDVAAKLIAAMNTSNTVPTIATPPLTDTTQ